MSRFKNEVTQLQAHIRSLQLGCTALLLVSLMLGLGWWSAPRDLLIHVPPDLRSGSVRPWWDVPPESVYAFAFYIFQQLNRWPSNGEDDYRRNIDALAPYLTPACQQWLGQDYERRQSRGSYANACAVFTKYRAAVTAMIPPCACAACPTATGW